MAGSFCRIENSVARERARCRTPRCVVAPRLKDLGVCGTRPPPSLARVPHIPHSDDRGRMRPSAQRHSRRPRASPWGQSSIEENSPREPHFQMRVILDDRVLNAFARSGGCQCQPYQPSVTRAVFSAICKELCHSERVGSGDLPDSTLLYSSRAILHFTVVLYADVARHRFPKAAGLWRGCRGRAPASSAPPPLQAATRAGAILLIRINSAARSPIIELGACVLPLISVGMTLASRHAQPSTPRTRNCGSSTLRGSPPMRQVPTGW